MDPDRVTSVVIPDFPIAAMMTPTSPPPMEGDTSELIAASDAGPASGRNESLAKIEITVLSVILVIAIVGNSLMLIALRRQLNFRPMSRMYFFMLNLSIADLFVAFGNILPQLAWDITFRFQGNDLLCRIVKFLQVFVLYVSTYILTSMAIDRYLVVCHHSFSRNYYSGLKGPRILVAASYIFSFLLATPQVFIFSYMEVPVRKFFISLHSLNLTSPAMKCWSYQVFLSLMQKSPCVLSILLAELTPRCFALSKRSIFIQSNGSWIHSTSLFHSL